eukprot:12400552-Prorocentrum_lima.AAC.1
MDESLFSAIALCCQALGLNLLPSSKGGIIPLELEVSAAVGVRELLRPSRLGTSWASQDSARKMSVVCFFGDLPLLAMPSCGTLSQCGGGTIREV